MTIISNLKVERSGANLKRYVTEGTVGLEALFRKLQKMQVCFKWPVKCTVKHVCKIFPHTFLRHAGDCLKKYMFQSSIHAFIRPLCSCNEQERQIIAWRRFITDTSLYENCNGHIEAKRLKRYTLKRSQSMSQCKFLHVFENSTYFFRQKK